LRRVTLDQWLGLGVFLAAIAGSSVTWYALALRCGFPPGLAAVPTIALDVGGIVFGRNWIFGGTRQLRKWGAITTILAVGLSVAGNGAEHAIAAGLMAVDLWLVVAVGAVPPAVLFAVAHQLALASVPVEVPGKRPVQPVYTPRLLNVDPESPEGVDALLDAGPVSGPDAEPEPEPDDDEPEAARHPSGTVVTLPHRETKIAKARRLYRAEATALLASGQSLDDIVLAEIDRAIGSDGYTKKHARRWRTEIEAEFATEREEG
jgi:hypothetical protein